MSELLLKFGLPLLIKMIGAIILKGQKNEAVKKSYLEFIDTMEHFGLASVNLNDDDRAQVDELRARRNRINQDNQG